MTSSSCFEAPRQSFFTNNSFYPSKAGFDQNAPKRKALSEINTNVRYPNNQSQYPPTEQMFCSHNQPKFQGFQFKPSNNLFFDAPTFTNQEVIDEADDWPDLF